MGVVLIFGFELEGMLEELKKRLKGKVLIIGIGNRLKGDDGAGPYLLEQLQKRKVDSQRVSFLNCEDIPESYTNKIKERKPQTILIIDAMDLGREAGEICIVETKDISKRESFSTHNIPLKVFADYLKKETKADIFFLGIQPKVVEFGEEISEEVKRTLVGLRDLLFNILV